MSLLGAVIVLGVVICVLISGAVGLVLLTLYRAFWRVLHGAWP